MFDGFFGWIRRSVRAAVVGGIQDGIADITTADSDVPQMQLVFRPAPEPKKSKKEA